MRRSRTRAWDCDSLWLCEPPDGNCGCLLHDSRFNKPVRPELVEGLSFLLGQKKTQAFDRLMPNG